MSDRLRDSTSSRRPPPAPAPLLDAGKVHRPLIDQSQMRALHAAWSQICNRQSDGRSAAERHAALRDECASLCGRALESLTALTYDEASRLLNRFNGLLGRRDRRTPAERHNRTPRGVLRPASPAQRAYIARLLLALGWPTATCQSFLTTHIGTADIERGAYTTAAASKVITALQAATNNPREQRRVAKDGQNGQ